MNASRRENWCKFARYPPVAARTANVRIASGRLMVLGGSLKLFTLAPCGVVCELCIAYQRTRNRCVGCNSEGSKPQHCDICSIKLCKEKSGPESLCIECEKYPCRRLKDLEKRYTTKYGESLTANMQLLDNKGIAAFNEEIIKKWICQKCGTLLSAHRDTCVSCNAPNPNYPIEEK